MASLYCEVCGTEIKNIQNPRRLLGWTHNEARKPVTCTTHRRASLYDGDKLKFSPLTGSRKR